MATADLSDSDLQEVFGETTGEPQSEDGSTAASAGGSLGGSCDSSKVDCAGGSVVGEEEQLCAQLSSLPGCSTVSQLHVSREQEQMALLQAHSAQHLQSIVNELQAALGQ